MLKKGFSKDSIGKNVATEMDAGKKPAVAKAIAFKTARDAAKKAGKSLKGLQKKD